MEMDRLCAFLKKHYLFCNLVGISIFLFFFELGNRGFENKDVSRYAEMSREMIQTGNWMTTGYHDTIYLSKPPMLMWLIAIFSSIGHQVTPFTARIPSALAGLTGVLMTYYFVQRFFHRRTAFIAAVILATTQKYFWHCRIIRTDMIFAVCITLALYFFYLGYKQKQRYYVGFYFSLVITFLTKGPLGILFVMSIIAAFLVCRKDLNAFKRMKWRWGFGLFILPIGIFCLILCVKIGLEPLVATLKREFLTRVNDPISHSEPFYYYFVKIWSDFLPWSLFIPFVVVYAFKRWRDGDELGIFMFCWIVVIFVFLCAAKAKSSRYMLPLYPAISILMARIIDDTLAGKIVKPLWVRLFAYWIIRIMAALAALLLVVCPSYLWNYSWIGVILSLVVFTTGFKMFLSLRQRYKLIHMSLVICIFTIILGWGMFIHGLTRYYENESLGAKLTCTLEKELGGLRAYDIREFHIANSFRDAINLNLNVSVPLIKNIHDLKTFLGTTECHPLCIIEKHTFENVKNTIMDNTLSTLDVHTKEYQVTLVFKRNHQKIY
ncbi:MAG: glycosyltransferase family 39 protein [Candidatus Brocadia sp.]|nr:MAG: glycosyltransferase family 39 protein [Candidatus Brocadia sp.]